MATKTKRLIGRVIMVVFLFIQAFATDNTINTLEASSEALGEELANDFNEVTSINADMVQGQENGGYLDIAPTQTLSGAIIPGDYSGQLKIIATPQNRQILQELFKLQGKYELLVEQGDTSYELKSISRLRDDSIYTHIYKVNEGNLVNAYETELNDLGKQSTRFSYQVILLILSLCLSTFIIFRESPEC